MVYVAAWAPAKAGRWPFSPSGSRRPGPTGRRVAALIRKNFCRVTAKGIAEDFAQDRRQQSAPLKPCCCERPSVRSRVARVAKRIEPSTRRLRAFSTAFRDRASSFEKLARSHVVDSRFVSILRRRNRPQRTAQNRSRRDQFRITPSRGRTAMARNESQS